MSKKVRTTCLVLVGIFVALPILAYLVLRFGYCHGWWAKENLILRSLWLCSCPAGFEQSLYPDHVKVMYPACGDVQVTPLTGGRYLFVRGDDSYPYSDEYLLDLVTSEKTPFFLPPDVTQIEQFEFLTTELLIVYSLKGYRLLDWQDGRSLLVEGLDTETLPPPYLSDGSLNPEALALFQSTEQIFLFRGGGSAVALAPDWWENPGRNFVIGRGQFPDIESDWIRALVKASGIPYGSASWVASARTVKELTSPDGRFVARPTGAYEAETGRLVAAAYQVWLVYDPDRCVTCYRPCCWLPDNSAVIYLFSGGGVSPAPTMYEVGAPGYGDYSRFRMPVLKINLLEVSP